jgi:hypothetical protein
MVTTQNKICFVILWVIFFIGVAFSDKVAVGVGALGLLILGLKVELSEQIEALKEQGE